MGAASHKYSPHVTLHIKVFGKRNKRHHKALQRTAESSSAVYYRPAVQVQGQTLFASKTYAPQRCFAVGH
jgi:hypothetical protein